MINKTRNKITINIGTTHTDELQEYTQRVAEKISQKYGGCSVLNGVGFWSQNGNAENTEHIDIHSEKMRQITTLSEDNTTKTRENIHRILKEASDGVKSIEWVNVELQQIRTGHINIQENSDHN